MHQQEEKDKEKDIPYFVSVEEFMKQNPAARYKSEARNYFSTSEILSMCNDIAFDDTLTEPVLYEILKGNHYEIIDMGNGIYKWIFE